MFKHNQMFSHDPAMFVQKERQLRSYHIRNWLKMNRTNKELLELCLNHFYSDRPKLLGWSLDIIDGDPKGLVLAAIIREGRANATQAEILYEQLQNTIGLSRALVEEVTRNPQFSTDDSKRALQDRVARAGVAPLNYSSAPSSHILIINRPTIISICSILLFLSAALTTLFIVADMPGSDRIEKAVGMTGLYFSIAFTVLCGWGYWNMKKWGVLLYALEPISRFFLGMPHSLVAIPLLIVAFGLMHIKDMTWK
ncbi:hypothetical protein L0156_13260 [bacterium]|nr:hypothetical protein [bacterium]